MRPPVREKPNPRILPMLAAIGLDRFHSINNPLSWEKQYLKKVVERGCFIDVKSKFDMTALRQAGLTVWRL
jgi:UDP-N-acetyl-D-galactosamine dehydrogenase